MKKNKKLLLLIAMILIFIISFMGSKSQPVENLEIPVGIGADIEKKGGPIVYKVPVEVYSFKESNKISSYILSGESLSIGSTRGDRQLKSGKRFILGLNKIVIFSEDAARNGLNNFMDLNINNAQGNDSAQCIVCQGKAEDMLKYKVKGYESCSDYMYGMMQNLSQFNFFSTKYGLMDVIVTMDAEGRTVLLPYIGIKQGLIETTGLAMFNKDKMVGTLNINEARVINMLKEDDVKGILTIQKSSKKYINLYATAKNKVRCYKENGKYRFVINLNLKGEIVTNQLYENLNLDQRQMKRFENDMEEFVEKNCNSTLHKIIREYKIDVLDLGRVAAAKYGRNTGANWNKIVSNSDIEVNVKVKVDGQGRGKY